MKNTLTKVATMVAVTMFLGAQANAASDGQYEVEFMKKCHEVNGVYSLEGSGVLVKTCRGIDKKLLGAYFPEQSYFLNGGDSEWFEKLMKDWGKKQ